MSFTLPNFRKIRNFSFFALAIILALGVLSQSNPATATSANKPKATSDVAFGSDKNLPPTTYHLPPSDSDYFYSKTSNGISAYLGKKGSGVPTVRYPKDGHFLEFSLNNTSSTTVVSLETNSKEPNAPTLFYRNIAEDVRAGVVQGK